MMASTAPPGSNSSAAIGVAATYPRGNADQHRLRKGVRFKMFALPSIGLTILSARKVRVKPHPAWPSIGTERLPGGPWKATSADSARALRAISSEPGLGFNKRA
jgi:hypothetical protein